MLFRQVVGVKVHINDQRCYNALRLNDPRHQDHFNTVAQLYVAQFTYFLVLSNEEDKNSCT